LPFAKNAFIVGCSQIRLALRVVKAQLRIAEIPMQHGPERIVVVHDARGGQSRAQCIQAVSDRRGNHHRIDAVAGDQLRKQAAVAGIFQRGVGDGFGQGQALQGWPVQAAVVEFQPFAVALPRVAAAGFQHQVMGLIEA
jgi:hypothetical protein